MHLPPLKRGCHQHPTIPTTRWAHLAEASLLPGPLYLGGLLTSPPGCGHAIPAGAASRGSCPFPTRKGNGKSEDSFPFPLVLCLSSSVALSPLNLFGDSRCQGLATPNQRQTPSRLCPESNEPHSSCGPHALHCSAQLRIHPEVPHPLHCPATGSTWAKSHMMETFCFSVSFFSCVTPPPGIFSH